MIWMVFSITVRIGSLCLAFYRLVATWRMKRVIHTLGLLSSLGVKPVLLKLHIKESVFNPRNLRHQHVDMLCHPNYYPKSYS